MKYILKELKWKISTANAVSYQIVSSKNVSNNARPSQRLNSKLTERNLAHYIKHEQIFISCTTKKSKLSSLKCIYRREREREREGEGEGGEKRTIPSKSSLLVRKDLNPSSLGLSAPYNHIIKVCLSIMSNKESLQCKLKINKI